ncbi:MAG: hypothetical protein JO142_15090 [Burkholderiales bacterium]|nr:hypothetical protein [Burkholderiales bacterium]
MMKIDGFLPEQQYVSSDSRRTDTANQRDAWLKQMEGAQCSLLEQSNGQTPQQGEKRSESHRNQTGSVPSAHQTRAVAASPVVAMKSVQVADATVQGSQRAPAVAHVAASSVTRPQASKVSNTLTAAAETSAHAIGLLASDTAMPRDAAMADLTTRRTDIQPGQFVQEFAVGPASALALDAEAGTPNPAQLTQVQPSSAAGMTLTLADQPSHAGSGTAEEAPSENPADPAPGGEHKEAGTTGEPWQKRMMHLTADGQDVSVSIRDNQLNHQASTQVIYRLAADVAAAGFRLRNVTINGKALLRPSREANTSQRRAPRDAASPNISNLDFLEQNHGA